jgi:hypothetical protein
MGAPKGHKKYGGRVAGTPNKKTQTLIEKCEARGLDIWEAMIELVLEAKGTDKFKMLSEMAQYTFPKRKAIEHSGAILKPRVIEIVRPDGTGERIVMEDEENE